MIIPSGTSRPITAVILALAAFTPPVVAQAAGSDSAAIYEAGRRFSSAYMRGDAAAISALYTADAVIFPARADAITGQDAIKRYWTPREEGKVTQHHLTPTRVVVDGKHAYDYGIYEVAGELDGKAWGPLRGKYLVVWRREPGGWRIHLDMWNSGPQPGS
jgi:ketosteroid isomerase-like protein